LRQERVARVPIFRPVSGACLKVGRDRGVRVESGCYEEICCFISEAPGGSVGAVSVAGLGQGVGGVGAVAC
jgi:hypothetical protein